MSVGTPESEHSLIVAPQGVIDASTADQFRVSLIRAMNQSESGITIDLSRVPAITSSAFDVLVDALASLLDLDHCRIVGVTPQVYRLFSLSTLDQIIRVECQDDRFQDSKSHDSKHG